MMEFKHEVSRQLAMNINYPSPILSDEEICDLAYVIDSLISIIAKVPEGLYKSPLGPCFLDYMYNHSIDSLLNEKGLLLKIISRLDDLPQNEIYQLLRMMATGEFDIPVTLSYIEDSVHQLTIDSFKNQSEYDRFVVDYSLFLYKVYIAK